MSPLSARKIRRLQIEGFRGALRPVEIDFGETCTSVVIYGDNGTGKSTFADAVEWFFTERIQHLAREGCQEQAYRNRRLPETSAASVQVVFDDGSFSAQRTLDSGLQTALLCPDDLRAYLNLVRGETFILRHAQMRDFVDKTKSDKLKYISDILGLGELATQRDQFASAVRQLRSDAQYKTLQTNINDYRKQFAVLAGQKKAGLEQALRQAEMLRTVLGGTIAIVDSPTLRRSTEALSALRSKSDRAQLIAQIESQRRELKAGVQYKTIYSDISEVCEAITMLRADKRAVDDNALSTLYSAGQEVLRRDIHETETCPLCGQAVVRDALLIRLESQLQGIRAIQVRMEQISEQVSAMRSRLDAWQLWATRISAMTWLMDETAARQLNNMAAGIVHLATEWASALGHDAYLDATIVVTPDHLAVVDAFARQCETTEGTLAWRVSQLKDSFEETERNQRLSTLERINQTVHAFEWAERRKAGFDRQIKTMESISKRFEAMEKAVLQQILAEISADVNHFYLTLHPDEGFDQVHLTPTENRGIEFEFRYHSERISPPGQLLSESHLNTLGICLFLAAARRFNRGSQFLILDDIVNSVDAGHRQMMGRLLRDEFADMQVLLLTHDEVWYEMVRRLTGDLWRAKKIQGWNYEIGFWFGEVFPDLDSEIRHRICIGQTDNLGNISRQWFEYRLKLLCYQLGIELPYEFNDNNEQRELRILLPKVKKHLSNSQIMAQGNNRLVFNDLEANQFVSNTLSHSQSSKGTPPRPEDIRLMLDDIKRLESFVTCPNCRKIVKRDKPCGCNPPFSWR